MTCRRDLAPRLQRAQTTDEGDRRIGVPHDAPVESKSSTPGRRLWRMDAPHVRAELESVASRVRSRVPGAIDQSAAFTVYREIEDSATAGLRAAVDGDPRFAEFTQSKYRTYGWGTIRLDTRSLLRWLVPRAALLGADQAWQDLLAYHAATGLRWT